MKQRSEYVLGVDLGTTSTAAAVLRDGKVRIVDLSSLGSTMPSVLWLDPSGDFLFGDAAEGRAVADPAGVAREFKRRFGDPVPLLLRGSPFSADDLSLRLLRRTVELVAEYEGGPPTEIVLCHPAGWGPFKLSLLTDALANSSLPPTTLIPEPLAAAIHYTRSEDIDVGTVVAIYDLGGGTFDVAFLRKTADSWDQIGSPGGLDRLGGVDFDTAIFDFVMTSLEIDILDLDQDDAALATAGAQLRRDCMEAKKTLSSNTSADIAVFIPGHIDQIRITRKEFEDLIRPALQTSVNAFIEALEAVDLQPEDIDRVLLVGGSSRIPLVSQTVGKATGRDMFVDVHPKFAVAMGAAASRLEASSQALSNVLPDNTPEIAEVSAADGPILPDSLAGDSPGVHGKTLVESLRPSGDEPLSISNRPNLLIRGLVLGLLFAGVVTIGLVISRAIRTPTQNETTAQPPSETKDLTSPSGETNSSIDDGLGAGAVPPNAQGPYGDQFNDQSYDVLGPQTAPTRRWELGQPFFRAPIVAGNHLYGTGIDEVLAMGTDDGRVQWSEPINPNFAQIALSAETLVVSQFDEDGVWLNLYDTTNGETSRFDLHVTDWDATLYPANVILQDGSVFLLVSIGRGTGPETPAYLIRLDGATGQEEWRHQRDSYSSEPLLGIDGLVVSLSVGEILAVSAETGTEIWRTKSGATELATLAGEAGTIVVQSRWFENGGTFALNSDDGSLIWHAETVNERAVISDGLVYIMTGSSPASVSAVSILDGSISWSTPLPDPFMDFNGSLAGDRQTIYAVNDPSNLDGSPRRVAAFDKADGALIWETELVDQNGLWIAGAVTVADSSLILQDNTGRISSWN